MKIGFLGAGSVARALGAAWAAAGHEVWLSSRDPQSATLKTWRDESGRGIHVVGFREAAQAGEVLVPAVQPWTVLQPLLASLAPESLAGKVVLELGNAVDWTSRPPRLALAESSLGEQVQAWLAASRVVKTLNMIPATRMAHPSFADGIPTLLMAGNDADAKATVAGLLKEIGWRDLIDLGDIRQSRLLENFMLTCLFAEFSSKAKGTAFALLRN